MSLNWNLKGIKNADTVCWQVAEQSDLMHGIKAGESYMTPLTKTMILMTMAVDLGEITEKNAEEFATRVAMLEAVQGEAMMKRYDAETDQWVGRPITLADVKAHIGLSTNVSNLTAAQFASKMAKRLRDEAERRIRREAREAAATVTVAE